MKTDQSPDAAARPPLRLRRAARNAERDAARREMILNGGLHQGVWQIALPSVATMLLQTTNGFLDTFFLGKLGPDALAAFTVASSLMFGLMSAAMAVSVGTTALVARFIGEGVVADAEKTTVQSLLISVLLGLVVGLPMWFLREPLLTLMGLDHEAHRLASHYLLVTVLGLPSLFLMVILNGVFRGLGDTGRPFWVTLGANLVHASFNYVLIFGNFGFPRLGLTGGALALALSQVMAVALYLIFLKNSLLRAALRRGEGRWRADRVWMWRIARIGLPASLQQALRVGSMLAFQAILARTPAGSAAVAALGIGLRSEAIAFMPGFGYAIAASAFVGQNLGAKQVTRANAGAWSATYQAVAVMTFMGLIFYTFAEPFVRVFVQHVGGESAAQAAQVEQTVHLAAYYLKVALWSEPFLALGMVLSGALQGAGETQSPTLVTAISMLLVRLPLAWVLTFTLGFGAPGAWWAMSASTIVQGIFMVLIFRRGRWRSVAV